MRDLLFVCLPVVGLLAGACVAAPEESVPVRLSPVMHDCRVTDLGNGVYEVRTTGTDPYVVCQKVTQRFDHDRLFVFSFDTTCPEGLAFFEVFFGNPFHGDARFGSGKVPPAADWQPFAANLKTTRGHSWNDKVTDFRIDFGNAAGRTIRVRNIRVRALTAAEVRAEEERQAEERRKLAELHQRIEKTLIAPARIPYAGDVTAAAHRFEDDGRATVVAVIGKELDLATQLREYAASVRTPVELPPALVVGEGAGPKNHTLVRVLNRHGICEVQFLAYPPSVRGGVQVAAARLGGQECIVTAPLADAAVREIRTFTRHGIPVRALPLPAAIPAPCVLAAGSFSAASPGDEVAVAPARVDGASFSIAILSGEDGRLVRTLDIGLPAPAQGTISLAAERGQSGADRLVAYVSGQPGFTRIDPEKGAVEWQAAGLDPSCTGVYPSAAGAYAATVQEPFFSSLYRVTPGGKAERQNVGERENLFWFTADGAFKDVPEGRYTRRSRFAHIRTDFMTPVAANPDFARTDVEFWAGKEYLTRVTDRLKSYDTDPPVCWEPCFTHRWFYNLARKWAAARDEETGLAKYTLVDRENVTGTYGEFGETKSFVSGSYAPGLHAVDSLYTYPVRGFLHELVARFRRNPEHFVAVEPNHEMEINAESETSHGDYNPTMIRAFYRYLASLYGDLDEINRVFGTPFTRERFDAPRDLQRGPWDAYSTENPYYLAWMRFMNYVVYRVVAGTYREALLAGFPPEAIKCHQIPDHYAIASLTAFSKPARRVTPIDWNLNAGVGYGCTKYGVWYNQEHNCVQGAHSSGFDGMVIGEYQSLHPAADVAYAQLAYMRDHGVQFIHCMNWPAGHDKGYNASLAAALRKLVAEDKPRPGITGGTGQVRPVRAKSRAYDIVSLGTRKENTGLIKSIDAQGRWEGSVYVVPFHAHVDVIPVMQRGSVVLAGEPLSCGPFPGIDAGNVVDVSFQAKAPAGAVSFRLYHRDIELPAHRVTMPVAAEWRHYRYQLRVQIDTDDLRIEIGSGDAGTWLKGRVEVKDLVVLRHTEKTTKLKKGIFAGERHEGGVTFDVLPD